MYEITLLHTIKHAFRNQFTFSAAFSLRFLDVCAIFQKLSDKKGNGTGKCVIFVFIEAPYATRCRHATSYLCFYRNEKSSFYLLSHWSYFGALRFEPQKLPNERLFIQFGPAVWATSAFPAPIWFPISLTPHYCSCICRDPINLAVLALVESGELTKLYNKWWFENTDCDLGDKQETARNELSLRNVAGIFFILIGGLIVSLIVALVEFIFNKREKSFMQQRQQHIHQHRNRQRLQHAQQQQQQLMAQPQVLQHPPQHNSLQGADSLKTKLSIQPACEYDNGTVGVSRRVDEMHIQTRKSKEFETN